MRHTSTIFFSHFGSASTGCVPNPAKCWLQFRLGSVHTARSTAHRTCVPAQQLNLSANVEALAYIHRGKPSRPLLFIAPMFTETIRFLSSPWTLLCGLPAASDSRPLSFCSSNSIRFLSWRCFRSLSALGGKLGIHSKPSSEVVHFHDLRHLYCTKAI